MNHSFDIESSAGVEGTYLIRFLTSEKGNVIKAERLNSIYNVLDQRIDNFLRDHALLNFKFNVYKVNGENVNTEMVIPLSFSVDRFYRRPSRYYFDHGLHMMMMQQNFSPSVPKF